MPYDKGDFTQQGINGDVSALVRLNEKRVMKVVLSSDDESDNCDISGGVYDLLNGTSYPLGGTEPTGTITITENGTGIDVAQYALADVNVEGYVLQTCAIQFHNNSGSDQRALSGLYIRNKIGNNYYLDDNVLIQNNAGLLGNYFIIAGTINEPTTYGLSFEMSGGTLAAADEVNCEFEDDGDNWYIITITDPTLPSSLTINIT